MDSKKPVRVYADGVYDLFHYGHARQLKQVKNMFPNCYLIIGVCGQEDVETFKGHSVLDGVQRSESVKHCKWVDEVIYPCPWVMDEKFVTDNQIDYVAHDDIPYATAGVEDAYSVPKKLGIFTATQRTEGISTSDIINKILFEREDYMKRNLQRGFTRQQLNLGLIGYYCLKFKVLIESLSCKKKKKKNQ